MCKRILFFTYYECFPKSGGTERTTTLVSRALSSEYGYKCYGAYFRHTKIGVGDTPFEESIQLNVSDSQQLAKYIDSHKIDYIVNQGVQTFTGYFNKAITQAIHPCRLVFAIHFVPGDFEKMYISLPYLKKEYKRTGSMKLLAMLAAYPLSRWVYYRYMKRQYSFTHKKSHRVVLLSDQYRKAWTDISGAVPTDEKVITIPNGLTFSCTARLEDVKRKEKRVLVVSRLQEDPKNISATLRIWQILSEDPMLKDWHLDIVGDGIDRIGYERWVNNNRVERVKFYGHTDPLPYYQKAAIFMMTSRSEGWGMTLLEASQMGCVPFAFNSYASLSDILTNGINGVVIPERDEEEYAQKMKELMLDAKRREELAVAAIENSLRFEMKNIVRKWHNLFNE